LCLLYRCVEDDPTVTFRLFRLFTLFLNFESHYHAAESPQLPLGVECFLPIAGCRVLKRNLRLLPEGLHYLFDIERLPRHNRKDRGVRNVSIGWVSLSHVPANPDKSRIGGIVPPALRVSIHSLLAGVTSAVPGIISNSLWLLDNSTNKL